MIKKSHAEFSDGHFLQAAFYLETLVKRFPKNNGYKYSLILSYLETSQAEKAIPLLDELERTSYSSNGDFYYYRALAAHQMEAFEQALKYIEHAEKNTKVPGVKNKQKLKEQILRAQLEYKHPQTVVLRNMGEDINSEANDHSVIMSTDHQTIYYTVQSKDFIDGYTEKIYSTTQTKDGEWLEPINMKGLKSDGNNATVQARNNDTEIILYNDGDLYKRRFYKGRWREPIPLEEVNSPAHDTHCFITDDGNRIYYATRLNNKLTDDLDLYYIEKDEKDEWSEPIPITTLNTDFDEDSPFIDEEGNIYFSSKGHNSIGGYDIFKATYNDSLKQWNEPVNLGYPVNSVADDIYFNFHGKLAYFSSNRNGGLGLLDLYRCFFFSRVKVKGKVQNRLKKAIPFAKVRLESEEKFYETLADKNGDYELVVPIDNDFEITIEKNNTIFHRGEYAIKVSFTDSKKLEKSFYVVNVAGEDDTATLVEDKGMMHVKLFNSEEESSDFIVGKRSIPEAFTQKNVLDLKVAPKEEEVNQISAEVFVKGEPSKAMTIYVDGRPFDVDNEGKFDFYLGKGISIPRTVEVRDEFLELETWYIHDNVITIKLQERRDFRLSGTILVDGKVPYVYNSIELKGPDGSLHQIKTNTFGVFDTIIDANDDQQVPQWEIGVPGREIQSLSVRQDQLHSEFKISVSEIEQLFPFNLTVVDSAGYPIQDVFTLFDGEYYRTPQDGTIKVEKELKGNFYASRNLIVLHDYDIKKVFYEELLNRVVVVAKAHEKEVIIDRLVVYDTISVEKPQEVAEAPEMSQQALDSMLLVQNEAAVEAKIFELWTQMKKDSMPDMSAIQEYKSELSRIKGEMAQDQVTFESMNSSLKKVIDDMEGELVSKEDEVEAIRREGYNYLIASLIMLTAFVTMSVLWRRVRKQKSSLATINDELDEAYGEVQNQKKQITDSLKYAQTLQSSILPMGENMKESFKDSFVYYKPRDFVSGDFYWHARVKLNLVEYTFIAVVDCTGHGVPGAFMSMMGYAYLQEILDKKISYEPDVILKNLDLKVREGLRQKESKNTDGMDMILLRLSKLDDDHYEVKYAGAKTDFYVYDPIFESLLKYKSDRKGVGGHEQQEKEFSSNTFEITTENRIFLLTDGILDQNGKSGRKYGRRRMEAFLTKHAKKSMKEIHFLLNREVDRYMEGEEQRDDMTMIGFKMM
ncbi:serine phosphatase RsbU (regulator of sigma subunit) [Sediminitomix flava]|uniref:Serine phosphatase RsbU (Regulator of sigma subunit) n=1 Tax=Sediminitomix flava TaxID=379075 RepID=A0A315ZGF7_SEDFL|nr:serine phosphatase RsbU (regulator of sigma subunit) [Sediminitomix flava]